LATIETPEEKITGGDGEDSRFREKKYDYKDAFYMRGIGNKDGSATFFYDLSLHPETFGRIDIVANPKK
jgi:hypothetical protein